MASLPPPTPGTVSKRTRLDSDRRRAHLIEVGLELFGARPYGNVSMDEVARRAEVSHGLLYHHFGDKRRFYMEVVRSVVQEMVARTSPLPDRTPIQRLYDGLAAHVEFAQQHSAGYMAIVSGGNGADAELRAVLEQGRREAMEHLLKGLGVSRPSPRLRIALRGWQGFVEGAIVQWLNGRRVKQGELVDLLAQALGAIVALSPEPGARDAWRQALAQ